MNEWDYTHLRANMSTKEANTEIPENIETLSRRLFLT